MPPDRAIAVLHCPACGKFIPVYEADLAFLLTIDWPQHCGADMEFHRALDAAKTPTPAGE